MSKKILKRSLALGALMAFVITGSAWAQVTYNANEDNPARIVNGDPYIGQTSNNSSVKQGGAIYNTGVLIVENTDFTKNYSTGYASSAGGAISSVGGNLTVNGCEFEDNWAERPGSSSAQGAAIHISGGNATISGSKFLNHTQGDAYGVIYVTASKNVTLENNYFEGNSRSSVHVLANSVVNMQGKNEFKDNKNNSFVVRGTVNFKEGSHTILSGGSTQGVASYATGVFNIEAGSVVDAQDGMYVQGTVNNNGLLGVGAGVYNNNIITNFEGTDGTLKYLDATKIKVTNNNTENLTLAASGDANDAVGGDASKLIGDFNFNGKENTQMVLDEGNVQGRKVVNLKLNETTKELEEVEVISKEVNTKSDAVSDAGMTLKGHWRAHMNDMNKRMGELRNANGEHGVWTRMVRGESEYQGAKMQYNQYQLGYDEKLSVDKRWTVGAAVTFSEGDSSYGFGSTDDKSTAFAIYGSKLNNDGTFVDLIARYAHLESDLDDRNYGTGGYSTNGMSVSAEFGKRIQQGNGLWIEPQVELTYGSVDSADVTMKNDTQTFNAHYDSMDSFIARAGFALGKDIKQGNVYARASYLYDFDGETKTQFVGGDPIKEDFGGGWWEVGVGANINLSKATYIYADIEKTFGGEVDTNWQWNLGVRYSF